MDCVPLFSDMDGRALPASFESAGEVTVLPFASIGGIATYQGRTSHTGIELTATGPAVRSALTASGGEYLITSFGRAATA
jgi:hypothetical protein